MRKILSILIIYILIQSPEFLKAQTTNDFSGWLGVFGRVELNNKFSLHLESQLRSNNDWENIQTLILRGGLNFNLTSNQVVTVGYAFISNRRVIDGVSGYVPEDRIWEQYVLNESFSFKNHFITIQNRFRLEQRFIGQPVVENEQLVTDGFAFVQRIRYFVRMIVPFKQTPERSFKKGTFFSIQNEVFFNIGNLSVVNGKYFDQNRAYFSLGYRFSPKYDTEIGYMNQFVLGQGTAKTVNNILQLATYLRL